MPNKVYTTQKHYMVCEDCSQPLTYQFVGSEMKVEWHDCPEHPSVEPPPFEDHSTHVKDEFGGCVKDSRRNCVDSIAQLSVTKETT